MIRELENEVTAFYNSIKDKRREYQTLYNYFLRYVKSRYSNDDFNSVKDFLTGQLSRFDIINSCVSYLEDSNVSSVTAIEKYLNSITFLYNEFFIPNGYNNNNLDPLLPFAKSLKFDVKDLLTKKQQKKLQEKVSIPAISQDEYSIICNYLDTYTRKSSVKRQISIIWKLLMLYGFKFERIKYLEIKDFNHQENTLKIRIDDNTILSLDLPSKLSKEIFNYINEIKGPKESYMFLNTEGKVIMSSFMEYHFKKLRSTFNTSNKVNAFNATGLAKFAINNLLKSEIAPYYIQIITGMEDIIIEYCEKDVLNQLHPNLSKADELNIYINKRIRGVHTFEDFKK